MKFAFLRILPITACCLLASSQLSAQTAPAEEEQADFTQTENVSGQEEDEGGVADTPDYEDPDTVGRLEIDEQLLKNDPKLDPSSETSAVTRKNARIMTLLIPPPRGQIVDRFGYPLAQNVICYQIALKFGQFSKDDEEEILAYGKRCLEDAKAMAGGSLWGDISSEANQDKLLLSHYKHRRWLPLPLTKILSEEEVKKLPNPLPKGLEILPIYKRVYPQGATAGHIIGYVGSKGKLPTGPINHMDPLWEVSEGRSSLEKKYDKELTGRPGVWRLMFDEQGNKILDELSIKPKPGGTVVTTLNLKWQQLAEKILAKRCKRGAFVVLDVQSGEVLVLASQPTFDFNKFVPKISIKEYKKYQADPNTPLMNRAYQGVYPPASTFKAAVAMAALEHGLIRESTTIYCPAFMKIGGNIFHNWSKIPEGDINVCRALARSTNTFFYKLALMRGAPSYFLSMANRLGMGQKTGLPIEDVTGTIPNEDWLRRQGRTKYYDGDSANYSIGQGAVLASPLQVAQMMVGIANGRFLPKLQLIRQVHDLNGNVIAAAGVEERVSLASVSNAARIVRKGLYDVVYSGTGGNARLSYTAIAGKTGTGQYGKNKKVGWFAGFLPYDNPKYAFVAFYEGRPNEKVGGSSHAAPMVKEFFESLKTEMKGLLTTAEAEIIVIDEKTNTPVPLKEDNAPVLVPVDPAENAPDAEPVELPNIEEIDDSAEEGTPAIEVEIIG